ncbi:MAG: adenylate/guanylate cyclase domain-containing protein, partial [Gemmobacter sp.]
MEGRLGLGALISIGTAGYSEREARRVRAVNVAAFIAAAAVSIYIVVIPGPNDPVTYCVVAGFLCAPLLHRFGPIAAPVLLLSLVWINAVRVMVTYGNSDGIVLSLLTSAALSVVLFGIDRLRLATAVMALVAVGAPALYLSVPAMIGDISEALMRASFALNLVLNLAILFAVVAYFARIAQQAEDRAAAEAARSDRLLRAMLPDAVAEALKARPGAVIAERHPAVSVVFADIEGFTALAGRTDPETLVTFLDRVYGAFDDALARHGLTKIKTSG